MRVTLAVTLGALALLVPAAGYARPAAISPRVAVTARAARRVSAVSRSPSSTPLASRAAPSSSQRQQRAAPAPAHPSDPPPATDADPAELGLRVRDDGALVSSCGRVLIDRLGDDVTSAGATHGAVVLGWKEGRDAPAKSQSTHTLGWLNADRFLAASRVKRWWMGPLVCRRGGRVPIETQFLLARCPAAEGARRGGGAGGGGAEPLYAVIIPLIDGAFRTTLCGNILSNELLLRTDSGDKDVCARRVGSAAVVAVGAEPYATLRRAFAAASEHLGTFRVRGAKPLPDHLDMFGWCTWDAFYSGVEPSGILRGVRTLREGGAPPRFVIVDDGWQTVDAGEANRQGVAFEDADAERASPAALAQPAPSAINLAVRLVSWAYQRLVEPAPFHSQRSRLWRWLSQGPLRRNLIRFFDEHTDFSKSLVSVRANAKFESELGEGRSLRALVSQLRAELGVRRVYCWHALAGYWSGVSPVSQEMRELLKPEWRFPQPAMDLLMVEPAVAWDAASFHGVGAIGPAQFGTFYGALHAYLEEAGVDGVKVDAQSGISPFGAGFGIGAPRYVQAAVHAMEASVGRHLSRGPASARECINCMCHSSENLLSFRETAVLRAGDDFYPRDDASHAAHIATVSYNSVFLGEIGACDWDMFQSALPSASLHAAARAVGGGAIYVSDHPGAHDFGLLRQLVLPDGRTLRATHAGRPTLDCLFEDVSRDGHSALKIWNANAHTGLIGAFNVQGSEWSRRLRRFVALPAPPAVQLSLRPSDCAEPRFQPGGAGGSDGYVLWRYTTGELIGPLGAADAHAAGQLGSNEWEVFTVCPLQHSVAEEGGGAAGTRWAALGLLGMMNGGGAIVDVHASPGCATVRAIGRGTFGLYAARAPSSVVVDGAQVAHTYDSATGVLELELVQREGDAGGAAGAEEPFDARSGQHEIVVHFRRLPA